MNLIDASKYSYSLCKEMLETADVVKKFDPETGKNYLEKLNHFVHKLFLTGEGSSRLFPAKNTIAEQLKLGGDLQVFTEGATQAQEYNLEGCCVLGTSNSGKTKEFIRLFHKLKENESIQQLGLTAHDKTPLSELSQHCHILQCGNEDAVAATKSLVEQALVTLSYLCALRGEAMPSLANLDKEIESVLTSTIENEITQACAQAKTLYFAGRNNGVAEELTLKTNEITRKRSAYLEGTYAVHGIEEVMEAEDVLIVIDPFEEEEEKFEQCLKDDVGIKIFTISDRKTRFPTLIIPKNESYSTTLQLCSGWNLLVEIGIELGIDLDKLERARKVGNEYLAS